VSIVNFCVNIVSCGVLAFFSKSLAVFYAFVGLMQLYDYLFWTHPTRSWVNSVVTKIAMLSNHLQPIVLALCIAFLEKKRIQPISKIALSVYVFASIVYTWIAWSNVKFTFADKHAGGSLLWSWNYQAGAHLFYFIFIFTLCVLLGQHYTWPVNAVLVGLTLLSIAFAHTWFKGFLITGRFWCWIAGFLPLFIIPVLAWKKR